MASPFKCPQLDRTATIKACNQLSKICEVVMTRISRADIEKYTRNIRDTDSISCSQARREGGQKWEHSNDHPCNGQVKHRQSRPRKYDIFGENLSRKNSSSPVLKSVKFRDCSLKLNEVNAGTVEKLNLQTPKKLCREIDEDKVCNNLGSDFATGNTEDSFLHNSVGDSKKRKSLKSPFEDETCKRIKLLGAYSERYKNCTTGEDNVTLPLNKDIDFENSRYSKKDVNKMVFDEETDVNHAECLYLDASGKQILGENSPESYFFKEISNDMVLPSLDGADDLAHNPLSTVPLCLKSENADEAENVCNSNSVDVSNITTVFRVSDIGYYASDDNVVKCKVENQLEFNQAGVDETTTVICMNINNISENCNNQTTLNATLNSRNENGSIPTLSNSYSLNDAVPDTATFKTPAALGVDEMSKHKLHTNCSTVMSNVDTNGELETQHSSVYSLVGQSVPVSDNIQVSNQGVSECVTDTDEIITSDRVTVSDVNRYFSSVASPPPNAEENKTLPMPTLEDQRCITVDDDDDDGSSVEIIDLSDSEEVINRDNVSSNDGDQVLPNDNTGEKQLTSCLALDDDNSRCSLSSNASEELIDLAAESEKVVVFDGASSIQLNVDKESTKTCISKNKLPSVNDSVAAAACSVSGVIISSRGDKEIIDLTDSDEIIIFDDINTVEPNNVGGTKSAVKNCASEEKSHTRSDITTMCIAFDGLLTNKDAQINEVTGNSHISVDVRSGEKGERSVNNPYTGKIRVKDPSNLGIVSSVPPANSSEVTLGEKLDAKHLSVTVSSEADMSLDLMITIYRDICKNSAFTEEDINILKSYKKYFNKTTDEIINEMGQIIHLAACENLNYLNYIEQLEKLLTEDTVAVEKKRAECLHNANMEARGSSFLKCLKGIVNTVNIRVLQDVVSVVYCRLLESFLRIDPANKKRFRAARDVIREMLVKVNCDKYYKLERIVYMDSYQFLKKYNTIIKLIQRYYDMIISVKNHLKLKHTKDSTHSKDEIKKSRNNSYTLLKHMLKHSEPVAMNALPESSSQPDAVSRDQNKQPLIRGILLLNGENMTRATTLSLNELLLLNNKTFVSVRQKTFLHNYKKYFLGTTEDKLLKLGEMLHVISCEMTCLDKQVESIKNLPHGSLKICEEAKIRAVYDNKLKQRGFDFIHLMKGITSKFHAKCFNRMVDAMYCRITEIFLKIDINNIKHFISIRDIVKKMLQLNGYVNDDLFGVLTMKEEDFVRSYNSIIHVLLVYYELIKSVDTQQAVSSSVDKSVCEQGATSNSNSEGNIVIQLSSHAVEVPIIKRVTDSSVVIV